MAINYYELLSLSTNDSTEAIQKALKQLRTAWRARATLSGTAGDHAHQMLQHIAKATDIFTDQTSRDRYDLSLLAVTEDHQTDWMEESERYFERGELIAAQIAAAKARQDDSTDLHALVMSAIIEMNLADQASDQLPLKDRYRQAQFYIDEATALDVNEEHIAEIHANRGCILARQQEWDQAIASFDLALERTTGDVHATIASYKARCLPPAKAAGLCLYTLIHATELNNDTKDKLVALCCQSIDKAASIIDNWPDMQHHYQRLLVIIDDTTTPAKDVVPHIKERITYCQNKIQWTQEAENLRQKLIDLRDTVSRLEGHQTTAVAKQCEVWHTRQKAEQEHREKLPLYGCGGCILITWTILWLGSLAYLNNYSTSDPNAPLGRTIVGTIYVTLALLPWAFAYWRRSKYTRQIGALRTEEAELDEAITSLQDKIDEKEKQRSLLRHRLHEACEAAKPDDPDTDLKSIAVNN